MYELDHRVFHSLIITLENCPNFGDAEARKRMLKFLPPEIEPHLPAPNSTKHIHITGIVQTCLDFDNGLKSLLEIVILEEEGTPQADTLKTFRRQHLKQGLFFYHQLEDLQYIIEYFQVKLEDIGKFYRAALPPDMPGANNVSNIGEMIELLAGTHKPDPLLVFVEKLAFDAAFSLQAKLRDWAEQTIANLKLDFDSKVYRQAQSKAEILEIRPCLLIVLTRPKSDPYSDSFKVRAYLFSDLTGEFENIDLEDRPQRKDELPEVLYELLDYANNHSGEPTRLMCEFFLPQDMLIDNEVDTWRIAEWEQILGMNYPVVVRALDRIVSRKYELPKPFWKERWKHLSQAGWDSGMWWVYAAEESVYQRLDIELKKHKQVACLGLSLFLPKSSSLAEKDALMAALDNGLPAALWLRSEHIGLNPSEIKEKLETLLKTRPLSELPDIIKDLRLDAGGTPADEPHLGRNLTLLWDDPGRIPPEFNRTRRLGAPSLTNRR